MEKKIAFLGLGTMGGAMANNIAKAGYEVNGYDPFKEACQKAEQQGINIFSSPAEACKDVEVILSSVPETNDVTEAFLGEKGALISASEGTVCFDLATITPEGSIRISEEAKRRGVIFLDTPVSGSAPHAIEGTLAIMVGGDKKALDKHKDILEVIGESVHHIGDNGAGLKMKLVTNHVFSGHLAVFAEALSLGKKAGLDANTIMEFLKNSVIPKMLTYKGTPLAEKDYTPTFRTNLMLKDLRMITAMAEDLNMPIPISAITRHIYMSAAALGHGDSDQNAILEFFDKSGAIET